MANVERTAEQYIAGLIDDLRYALVKERLDTFAKYYPNGGFGVYDGGPLEYANNKIHDIERFISSTYDYLHEEKRLGMFDS